MLHHEASAILHHLMEMRQKQFLEGAANLAKPFLDQFSEYDNDESIQITETKIYIGLNDSHTKKQEHKTERYLSILKDVCKNYHVAFSVDIEEGGYFHDDGEYTEEVSLILVMLDADKKVVQEIAKDLCNFFRQESVLITENHVTGYFIKGEPLLKNETVSVVSEDK